MTNLIAGIHKHRIPSPGQGLILHEEAPVAAPQNPDTPGQKPRRIPEKSGNSIRRGKQKTQVLIIKNKYT